MRRICHSGDWLDQGGQEASTIQPLVDKNSNQLAIDVAPGMGLMYSDLTKIRQ
jgi:hypothetical protein